MKKFSYNRRVWGEEDASLSVFSWASLKLGYILTALENVRGKVLDLGCGGGAYTRGIKNYRSDFHITGVDISKKSITYARKKDGDINYVLGSVYSLPFNKNFFDAVVSIDALEHFDNPSKAFKEVYRVLKPGGVFHFALPLEGDARTLMGLIYRLTGVNLKENQVGHVARFTYKEILEIAKSAGFRFVSNRFSVHGIIQIFDFINSAMIAAMGGNSHEPDFSLEKHVVKGNRKLLKIFVIPYKVILLIHFLESKLFSRIIGYSVNMTVKKHGKSI